MLPSYRSDRARLQEWERLRKPVPTCSPFDAKGTIVYGLRVLQERICDDQSPCCSLVSLYAKMGLHRYNLLEGKNYRLLCVNKYHFRRTIYPTSYFITLEAIDPSTSLLKTFHTRIDERLINTFALTCNIARIRGETNKYQGGSCCAPGSIPEWPRENPFEDGKRFHVLNNSEVQDNLDWIYLYLELAVAKCRCTTMDPDLSNLKIVNVAIETHDLNEGLNSKNATVYISYKDSREARVGKDADRIAIVRRTFSEGSGCFNLMGQHQSEDYSCEAGVGKDADRIKSSFNEHTDQKGQDLSKEKKCKYQRVVRRLGVLKPWRWLGSSSAQDKIHLKMWIRE